MLDQEVRFLYRFRPINKNSLDELRNNYTWLSDPSSFNDPMDNPVIYNLNCLREDCFDDRFSGEELYDRIRESGRLRFPDLKIWLEKNDKKDLYKLVRSRMDIEKEKLTKILSNFGIVCFTPCLYNKAMWSYYADSHRGFCLEYNRINDPLFSRDICRPVRYVDKINLKFPLLDFTLGESVGLLFEALYSKYNDWCHEREWRSVYFSEPGAENQFRKKEGAVIKSIIFGMQSSPQQVLSVLNSLKDSDRKNSIRFSKMEPGRDLMEMIRTEYDSFENIREEMKNQHRSVGPAK